MRALEIALGVALVPTAAGAEAPTPLTLPIVTPELTPGTVERRAVRLRLTRPLFIVGDDARSIAWLRQHVDALQQLGAQGLIVNVTDAAALARLSLAAPGVPMAPVQGSSLARTHGLTHYPVLLSAEGLEP